MYQHVRFENVDEHVDVHMDSPAVEHVNEHVDDMWMERV